MAHEILIPILGIIIIIGMLFLEAAHLQKKISKRKSEYMKRQADYMNSLEIVRMSTSNDVGVDIGKVFEELEEAGIDTTPNFSGYFN